MDFWSRLLSHTSLVAGHSKKDVAKDPVRRRHRFEKEYGQLLQTWRNSSNLLHDLGAADTIELRIQELTDILQDESRRPLPHTCLNYSAEKQIYVPIGKIAATSYNLDIIKEAVYFFGTLIESEDDVFVENDVFASSLTTLLVRVTGANSIRLDDETEIKVVELAFNITTKIRLKPDMLAAWFRTHSDQKQQPPLPDAEKESDSHERFKGKTQRQDFPLFYVLMDYIHSEGKIGDFARTGLLYIIEAASSTITLEQWIVESDLSTLMATGLGALYSQLSRKLVIDYPSNALPPILALSDYEHPRTTLEIVSSCSPDFQVQLDTFLSHLLFWQDVLNHCRSVDVKSTLLEHFQVIFLQQLLYPSLLESSDIDGGSSVAVLTYLRRILESLDHPDMINLILHYLLALPDVMGAEPWAGKNAVSAARKRKSMDLATMMAAKAAVTATPLLFNLVDLILACLKSHSQQTIHVTLQLVSVILRRHHRYAVMTLLRTEAVPSAVNTKRTVGAHQQEVEFFMSMAGIIGGQDNFDDIYDSILRDTVIRLEGHPCSLKLIAPRVSTNNHDLPAIPDSLPGAPSDVSHHTIRPDDPLLTTIIDHLETFFINPVDTNLSVTEAILDLATCGFIALEGWVVRHPDNYVFADHEDFDSPVTATADADSVASDEVNKPSAVAVQSCRRRPTWAGLPRLLHVLEVLSEHVTTYHQTIPRFGDLLQQRREAFQTADTAPSLVVPQTSSNPAVPARDRSNSEDTNSDSPFRSSGFEGFAQRLLSELGNPNRSVSPRGKKEFTLTGGFGVISPLPERAPGPPPKEFPLVVDVPSRRASSQLGEAGASDGRDNAVASQMAAFQAVDRQILARQVGIPSQKEAVDPIPLNFNKQPVEEANVEAVEVEATEGQEAQQAQQGQEGQEGQEGLDAAEAAIAVDSSLEAPVEVEEKTVTVSHILTNALILQSFLLELAALLQARAGLFDEVRFA